MHKVLIVDDDDVVRRILRSRLETEGYAIMEAAGREALFRQLEKQELPQIILLDVVLDKDNGVELIAGIRKYTDAPIIMVSSKSHLFDKIIALEMGADDYMGK